MRRAVRRLVWLTVLLGAAAMTARWWASRSTPQPSANPQWPPFEPPVPAARPVVSSVAADAGGEATPAESTAVVETTPAATPAAASIAEAAPTESASDSSGRLTTATGAPTWVLPVDGECPEGYPIKANDNSRIYHVPGGRSYARTKAERCYVDAESAAADGYRAAKA